MNRSLHGLYTSICTYAPSGATAAGGLDELATFRTSAAARAFFGRNAATAEKVAKQESHVVTEGTPPYQFTVTTKVTSTYFLAGKINGDESAFETLHTEQVTKGPGGPGSKSTYSSSGTTGFILAKNQIFDVTFQNSLNPEVSTYPSQVRHLLVKVAHEL